jgi:hypothetical protein
MKKSRLLGAVCLYYFAYGFTSECSTNLCNR